MAEITAAGGAPLIQEALDGRLAAFSSVVGEDGRLLARVQQEAERTWPRDLGCSVRARTVAVDEALAERVAALLADLGWTGLSELQFVVGADREPRLIDFNGRFYGSLALAMAAGPNLPALSAAVATGRPDRRPGRRRAAGSALPVAGGGSSGRARALAGSRARRRGLPALRPAGPPQHLARLGPGPGRAGRAGAAGRAAGREAAMRAHELIDRALKGRVLVFGSAPPGRARPRSPGPGARARRHRGGAGRGGVRPARGAVGALRAVHRRARRRRPRR